MRTLYSSFILFIVVGFYQLNAQDNGKTVYTVMYFGASDCGPCNRKEVIEAIHKLKTQFSKIHKLTEVKFIVVCIDTEIDIGIKFIKKYNDWDEFSIGSHYENEIAMQTLNKTQIPGMPHIIVYKDNIVQVNDCSQIDKRETVIEVLGGDKIVEWSKNNFQLP